MVDIKRYIIQYASPPKVPLGAPAMMTKRVSEAISFAYFGGSGGGWSYCISLCLELSNTDEVYIFESVALSFNFGQ